MTAVAATVQAFFTERLISQRQASSHTVAAYRDAIRMLLLFASDRTSRRLSKLDFVDLDATTVAAFLDHLERERANSVRSRNARLAAIHSLFAFAALHHTEHSNDIARILAIPARRTDHRIIEFLTDAEVTELLDQPDRSTNTGRRDYAMLHLAVQTGLRASELTALRLRDIHLGTGPHVSCMGKGRKRRVTTLTTEAVNLLRAWTVERGGQPDDVVFPTNRGRPLSHDALAQRLALYAGRCPRLAGRAITPHVLRHTTAKRLLHAGVDIAVIALWLGHESVATTQIRKIIYTTNAIESFNYQIRKITKNRGQFPTDDAVVKRPNAGSRAPSTRPRHLPPRGRRGPEEENSHPDVFAQVVPQQRPANRIELAPKNATAAPTPSAYATVVATPGDSSPPW